MRHLLCNVHTLPFVSTVSMLRTVLKTGTCDGDCTIEENLIGFLSQVQVLTTQLHDYFTVYVYLFIVGGNHIFWAYHTISYQTVLLRRQ